MVPEAWQFSRAFLPNKAQYFALGVVSAIVVREGPKGWSVYLAVLGTALAVSAVQGGVDKLLPPAVWTACLAAQVVPSSRRMRGPGHWISAFAGMTAVLLQSRPLVWLGAVSYCIYLVNEPVQKLLGVTLAMLAHGDSALFTALWIPGAVALPILASWWLHERIEVPAQRYGRGMALASVSPKLPPPIMRKAAESLGFLWGAL